MPRPSNEGDNAERLPNNNRNNRARGTICAVASANGFPSSLHPPTACRSTMIASNFSMLLLLPAQVAIARKDSLSQAARAPKWWQPETPTPEPLARQSISNSQVGRNPGAPTTQAYLPSPRLRAMLALLYTSARTIRRHRMRLVKAPSAPQITVHARRRCVFSYPRHPPAPFVNHARPGRCCRHHSQRPGQGSRSQRPPKRQHLPDRANPKRLHPVRVFQLAHLLYLRGWTADALHLRRGLSPGKRCQLADL